MTPTLIHDLARISKESYETQINVNNIGGFSPIDFADDSSFRVGEVGFVGHSYFSQQDNRLVISFAGTADGSNQGSVLADFITDGQFALFGSSNQDNSARFFSERAVQTAVSRGHSNFEIVYTGHSLGGFLAQTVGASDPNAQVIVFNSPGTGGVLGLNSDNNNVSYYFSDPSTWSGLDRLIHNTGALESSNVFFIAGAEGHGIDSAVQALDNNGGQTITPFGLATLLLDKLGSGEINHIDVINIIQNNNSLIQAPALSALAEYVDGLSNSECFLAGTSISMWDGTSKPIEEITPDNRVVSYDKAGKLVPGRVTRTFQNRSRHILNVHGLEVTPGHATFCADGKFANRHVPIIDILRSDGAMMKQDGRKYRAATGCEVGSMGDQMIHAVTGDRQDGGKATIKTRGQIRAGTRIITDDGKDLGVLSFIKQAGGTITDDGFIRLEEDGIKRPFHWCFTDTLPKPEDYILKRSGLTLHDIYQANEWEAVGPQLPIPTYGENGPVISSNPAMIAASPPNIPLIQRDPSNQPTMTRAQRRAFQARQRKQAGSAKVN